MVPLILNGNEIRSVRAELLSSNPAGEFLYEGRFWYNTALRELMYYDGIGIVPINRNALKMHGMTFRAPNQNDLAQIDFPSGDSPAGKFWGWNVDLQQFVLQVPEIAFGPAALDATTGPKTLPGNTDTQVYTGYPLDGIGFRSGLVQYIPAGRWTMDGIITIAGRTGVTYEVLVWQGTTPSSDTVNRPKIISDSKVKVGGGIGVSNLPDYAPLEIPFTAYDIQFYPADIEMAAEISVSVYPKTADNTAAALSRIDGSGGSPGVPDGHISRCLIMRMKGMYFQ